MSAKHHLRSTLPGHRQWSSRSEPPTDIEPFHEGPFNPAQTSLLDDYHQKSLNIEYIFVKMF